MTASVIVSLRVGASPLRAFEAFTNDIGQWWVQNPLFMLTPRGDGCLRFEPGEGGRLVTTLPDGSEFEVGRPRRCLGAWEAAGIDVAAGDVCVRSVNVSRRPF